MVSDAPGSTGVTYLKTVHRIGHKTTIHVDSAMNDHDIDVLSTSILFPPSVLEEGQLVANVGRTV